MQKYIQKIKEERERQNITIKELCLQANVTETTYFNLMAGKNIGIFTFFKFLEILKIDS